MSDLLSQKAAIQGCFKAAHGDKNRTICIYASLDNAGLVSRKSNVTPRDGANYGCILYHTARRLGWFKGHSSGLEQP